MKLGKKYYQSSAIWMLKILIGCVMLLSFLYLLWKIHHSTQFQIWGENHKLELIDYLLIYPEALIIYLLTILLPGVYYGLIRRVSFYEGGIKFNRGLPFLNMVIGYDQIESYALYGTRHLVAIKMKQTEDEYFFGVRNVKRVVAILDQQGIPGNLREQSVRWSRSQKKLMIYFFVIFFIFLPLMEYIFPLLFEKYK